MKKKVSLSKFVSQMQSSLKKFEENYLVQNVKNPTNFPLELPEDNSGLWFEFFSDFCEEGL